MNTPLSELTGLNYTQSDILRSIVNHAFIADYGIVKQVNSDKTIDVTHAIMGQLINGDSMPVTETRNIEVLFPASAAFGQSWPIAVGDGVLLIGLRDAVASTKGIQAPTAPPNEFLHYSQNTMKAIPLQKVSSPKVTINVTAGGNLEIQNTNTGGLIQVKNATKSLYTVLNNIITHLSTFAGGNVVSLGAPLATSAAAITQLTTDAADLAALLEP
jgi:hypothetical protein